MSLMYQCIHAISQSVGDHFVPRPKQDLYLIQFHVLISYIVEFVHVLGAFHKHNQYNRGPCR